MWSTISGISFVFVKEKWNADDMKRRILKECRVIGCNIKNNDKPFWWSHVYWIYFFLHMLNYSCANAYLFNRIHWLLISNNITLLYLSSNKDVIRAIYIFFLSMSCFYRCSCLGCLNGRYATDRRSHLYNCKRWIYIYIL
jgi:hypothetical protein